MPTGLLATERPGSGDSLPVAHRCRFGGTSREPWNIDKRTVQLGDGWAAQELEGPLQVGAQDLEHARDTRLTRGRESIRIGAAQEHRARAEADRLEDVTAAPHAAIHQHLHLTVHGGRDFGQGAERRRSAVQLPPAVVRDDDGSRAAVDRAAGVLAGQDPLDPHRPRPQAPYPTPAPPPDWRVAP